MSGISDKVGVGGVGSLNAGWSGTKGAAAGPCGGWRRRWPSSTALATLSGTDATSNAWADTTYTCSGSGCSLSASATYFVVIESDRADSHAWAVATTDTQSTYPTNSGWDTGYGHSQDTGGGRPWYSYSKYHPVRVVFTTTP